MCALLFPTLALAQDFGVLNSAETINRGNFKLNGAPVVTFGKDGSGNNGGAIVSGGYGLTDRVDVEGRLAFLDNVNFYGGDVEVWVVKNRRVDVSLGGGFHFGDGRDRYNNRGIDVTFLTSGHVTPRLELYGAFDMAIDSITGDLDDSDAGGDYTTVHLVPGIEYRIGRDIDLVAEFGIGLNADSRHYLAGGLAFYFR
jgi:hypothetical protein